MTEKQLFYPLLSVYFSLILGDLQKEKLQIVSIFRFGHKKRGLFQCPPKGKEQHPNILKLSGNELPPLGEGMGRGLHKQQQLCRSCDSPAQGCGRSTLPWVTAPTNLATLQELRLAVGVILNLMISTNPFLPIILLRVTPSANRNTYRVATPYYIYTQGRGAARLNPGL